MLNGETIQVSCQKHQNMKIEQTFLSFFSKEDVLTEVKVLDVLKAIQESNIPVKTTKANENFFAEAPLFLF